MECTPKGSLTSGLVCSTLLAIGFGYYGKKLGGDTLFYALAACSVLSSASNSITLIQNDKETVCQ